LTGLNHLGPSGTRVSDSGQACLRGLINLCDLFLGNTSFSDAGLAHVKGLSALRNLCLR
jgi:internalin A